MKHAVVETSGLIHNINVSSFRFRVHSSVDIGPDMPKGGALPPEFLMGPLTVSICRLGAEPFDLDLERGTGVWELKWRIQKRLELDSRIALNLVVDTTILDDSLLVADAVAAGSSILVLMQNPGPICLEANITDHTVSDDVRPAARSKELWDRIQSIEVSAAGFHDQDHGNCKANLFLTLKREEAGETQVLVRKNLYGTYREAHYKYGPSPPTLTLTDDEPLVFLAEPGSYYQMEYTVGGGGGHSITVVDWVCKIFYVNSSCITPSETVNFDIGGLAWFRELVHVAVQQLRRWGDLVCWTLAKLRCSPVRVPKPQGF